MFFFFLINLYKNKHRMASVHEWDLNLESDKSSTNRLALNKYAGDLSVFFLILTNDKSNNFIRYAILYTYIEELFHTVLILESLEATWYDWLSDLRATSLTAAVVTTTIHSAKWKIFVASIYLFVNLYLL